MQSLPGKAHHRRWLGWLLLLAAILFITGCAITTGVIGRKDANFSSWHGRLALRVEAEASQVNSPGQSFSGAFELQGNAQQGSLLLLTPLGSTAASLRWTPATASLQSGGETREFADLPTLINHLLGTPIPVSALFAWLDGQPAEVDGWQVDLTRRPDGKITARRFTPPPGAELRLVLEE